MGRCGLGEAFDDLTSLCLVFSTDILAQFWLFAIIEAKL